MAGFDDRNVIPLFISRYEQLFNAGWAMQLSTFVPNSVRGTETYGMFGGYPKMREWVGQRQAQVTAQRAYSIRNLPYESTLIVAVRMLSRDQSGLLEKYIGGYAQNVVVNQWEDLLVQLINTNGAAYDGNPFFSTAHQFGAEGAQSNQVTAADVPSLDVSVPANPTAAEAYAAVLGLIAYMMMYKDDKGRYLNQNAKEFYAVVSTPQLMTALQLPMTSVSNAADTPLSRLNAAGFKVTVLFLPGLTGATAKIRLYRADGELKPFILQEEQAIEYNILGRGSDFYFENKAIKLGVDASRGAGYGLFEYGIEGLLS